MKHTRLVKCPFCAKTVKYTQTEEGKLMLPHNQTLKWGGRRGQQIIPCRGSGCMGMVMPGYEGGGERSDT